MKTLAGKWIWGKKENEKKVVARVVGFELLKHEITPQPNVRLK